MGPRPNKTQILHVGPFVGIGPSGHHGLMWPRPKICFLNGIPLDSAGQSLPWGLMGHRPQKKLFQCGPSGPLGSRAQIWVNKYVLECLTHWAAPLVRRPHGADGTQAQDYSFRELVPLSPLGPWAHGIQALQHFFVKCWLLGSCDSCGLNGPIVPMGPRPHKQLLFFECWPLLGTWPLGPKVAMGPSPQKQSF